MARNDMPIDQEETGGGFERILMFLIPIIFTVVLVGVLLTLFNVNVRNGMMDLANKIPIVKNWVPDPVLTPEQEKEKKLKEQEESAEATIQELKKQLAGMEQSVKEMTEQKAAQENIAKSLQAQIDELQKPQVPQEEEEDSYEKQIRDLAKMYADMSPSKAAPIMQNLTTEEMVLMFSEMKGSSRVAILEKMDPKTAAEATMKLKDAKPSKDMAIAALQSRLKKDEEATAEKTPSKTLDKNQLNLTFSQMTPASASELLVQTYKISPQKTLTILKSVNDSTRAKILSVMSTKNPEIAAKIVNLLMGAK